MPGAAGSERGAEIVFIVDDEPSMCEALSSLLRAVCRQVRTFTTAAAFLEFPRPDMPACLVLDVRLAQGSGLELQRTLAKRGAALPIIFMAGHGDIQMSVPAMKAGAAEFLVKPFRVDALIHAVSEALESDAAGRQDRAELAEIHRRIESLSPRERDVMLLVVKGMLNKRAAAMLGIAEGTVKVHRRRVMEKLGVHSLPDLVRMVERVQPTDA